MEHFYMIVNVEVERPMQLLRCLEETLVLAWVTFNCISFLCG